MRKLSTLKPGQKGTWELLRRHGASLLCVRCRCDENTREHLRPVEFVVERCRGEHEAENPGSRKPGGWAAVAAIRRVALRIRWRERDLQRQVESAGGRWDPVRRVRFVGSDVAERLDPLGRVVGRRV